MCPRPHKESHKGAGKRKGGPSGPLCRHVLQLPKPRRFSSPWYNSEQPKDRRQPFSSFPRQGTEAGMTFSPTVPVVSRQKHSLEVPLQSHNGGGQDARGKEKTDSSGILTLQRPSRVQLLGLPRAPHPPNNRAPQAQDKLTSTYPAHRPPSHSGQRFKSTERQEIIENSQRPRTEFQSRPRHTAQLAQPPPQGQLGKLQPVGLQTHKMVSQPGVMGRGLSFAS